MKNKNQKKNIFFGLLIVILFISSSLVIVNANTEHIKKEYYPDGRLKSVTPFKDGKINGIKKIYSDDESLWIEISYRNGIKHGVEKWYHRNNKVSVFRNYKNGRIEGAERIYYKSGQLESEYFYENGEREGIAKGFYESGQYKWIVNYKNGNSEGDYTFFYPSGIWHKLNYKQGKLIGEEIDYNKDGEIIRKILHDGKGNSKVLINRNPYELEKIKETKKQLSIVNKKYLISTECNNELRILNLENLEIRKKQFEFRISGFETCSSFNYINLETRAFESNEEIIYNYIYDIESNILLKTSDVKIWPDTKRWSDNGIYTYIGKEKSFIIIETKYLIDYLKSKSVPIIAEIIGHPDVYIRQKKWLGHFFLYVAKPPHSGKACWGLFDAKEKKNYFVSCCGLDDKTRFLDFCDFYYDPKAIVNVLSSVLERNNLIKISNDFRNEAFKITGDKDWKK